MLPIHFNPISVFDETKHAVDLVAKTYLEKAADDVHHLLSIDVPADGNCLYHSVTVFMNNSTVTTDELRGKNNLFFFYAVV
jgi:hypothetical protein